MCPYIDIIDAHTHTVEISRCQISRLLGMVSGPFAWTIYFFHMFHMSNLDCAPGKHTPKQKHARPIARMLVL